jgi:hypothetical protein
MIEVIVFSVCFILNRKNFVHMLISLGNRKGHGNACQHFAWLHALCCVLVSYSVKLECCNFLYCICDTLQAFSGSTLWLDDDTLWKVCTFVCSSSSSSSSSIITRRSLLICKSNFYLVMECADLHLQGRWLM